MILKLLITRGNITLTQKEVTEEEEKENLKIEKNGKEHNENQETTKNEND